MFTKEQFGARLRCLRQKHHEAQGVLGGLLGVTATQISDIEKGKASTTLEKLAAICEHYKVSADYLLGLTNDPTPVHREGVEGEMKARPSAAD